MYTSGLVKSFKGKILEALMEIFQSSPGPTPWKLTHWKAERVGSAKPASDKSPWWTTRPKETGPSHWLLEGPSVFGRCLLRRWRWVRFHSWQGIVQALESEHNPPMLRVQLHWLLRFGLLGGSFSRFNTTPTQAADSAPISWSEETPSWKISGPVCEKEGVHDWLSAENQWRQCTKRNLSCDSQQFGRP